ncbi:T9SS type A sorting domain-containing protein [Flavobacterium succinicans]|uniref:Secretion system C-terminal sorting domain-containing protein n=1 Tax=Flavobacterium succinicans TaxID=29536 RepID=A0A199XTI7_9FLAO|nr:T9SS type A sorting domain-containing protein [Flavobacterium succinicans]OAZ04556.1 hypothetical protein FLB_10420 [Flavobacterium succinicans]
MIKNFFLSLFLVPLVITAQNITDFNNDSAGNRVLGQICISCSAKNIKPFNELKQEDLQVIDKISFYTNPVSQELYLTWKIEEDKKVEQIQLLSSGGNAMVTFMRISNWLTMRFQGYPSGHYFIVFTYSNGDNKTIKIVKK